LNKCLRKFFRDVRTARQQPPDLSYASVSRS
jgi:hypothetical protein